jgi:hypothetical protein
MAKIRKIPWWEIDKVQASLETDVEHEIQVQREAIPLVFVPGIMGSRLRVAGEETDEKQKKLPKLRWDPSDTSIGGFMWTHFIGASGAARRRMLVGAPNDGFKPEYLEVDNEDPYKDGVHGVFNSYEKFLKQLKDHDWGEVSRIFEFPVYAVGYNWTASNRDSGKKLVERIKKIIEEAKGVTGLCEKVIVITHSMGGIVARAASALCGGESLMLGIIHTVQPAAGAPAAYWRMKAGFEGSDSFGFLQKALGNSGPKVTSVLGNIPGGLELLPNQRYRHKADDSGYDPWLVAYEDGTAVVSVPKNDPYADIYEVPAVPAPTDDNQAPSGNAYWGLVDPALLNPREDSKGGNADDALDEDASSVDWKEYKHTLGTAKQFHKDLDIYTHPHTLCLAGTGSETATVIEFKDEWRAVKRTSYLNQGFRGYFTNAKGKHRIAVLGEPKGAGDGTVPLASAQLLNVDKRPSPGDSSTDATHQGAYDVPAVRDWAYQAVLTMCKLRYYEKHGVPSGASSAKAGGG